MEKWRNAKSQAVDKLKRVCFHTFFHSFVTGDEFNDIYFLVFLTHEKLTWKILKKVYGALLTHDRPQT